ncbi:DUF3108 domain-containing protein [Acidihalobacter ferrooxydans]|uniref:DUF3108 domain-containing protein n=1 Tax=Acidihalobacter ferrooxydans TaxID=1765967 RepID=A0A1P8UJB6_9GAMM|nr:DUF3108 domain-containing protein [Acidihalobacter ferrooxydans]APZ43927.1 hypothetical protein BW247_13195 [Acidihalobacter ferrooxydans]
MPTSTYKRLCRALCRAGIAALLLATPLAHADGAFGIPFFTAKYILHQYGIDAAESTISLQPDGTRIVYTQRTHAIGFLSLFFKQTIAERSLLAPDTTLPLPTQFTYDETGGGKNIHARILFDRKTLRATGTDRKGKPVNVAIEPDTVDFLSIQLAIIQAVAQHKKRLDFTVVQSADKLNHYHFAYAGTERIHTPMGTLDTVIVQRFRDHKKVRYDFYLAPALHYLPVKLTQTKMDNGSTLTLSIQSVHWNTPANATGNTK